MGLNKTAEARERSRASSGCSRRKSSRQPCGVNGGGRVLKGPHHDSSGSNLPALTDWCLELGAWGLNILSGESWPQKEARGHVRSRGKEMAQSGLSSPVLL